MTTIIIVAIIAAVAYYIYYMSNGNHEETQKRSETPSHPAHFDLLDENGDPIPSSDDSSRASAPHPIHESSVQRLRYFCIKDKGYHVSVWPKDQGFQGIDYIEFNIAGMSHCDNIDNYFGEFKGTLEGEPTNAYDPNAIKVLAPDGHHVGYVPKDMTSEIRGNATLPCQCFCYIGENGGVFFSDCYICAQMFPHNNK